MIYKTICADPPWPYDAPRAVVGNGGRGSQGGRAAEIIQASVDDHYPTMTLAELKALNVPSDTNAHLYLWTTNAFMVEAHDLARAWGFKPKTIITWVKVKADGTPSMKTGYYYRGATEHMLFCVKGSMRLTGHAAPTCIMSPRLGHSVKPDCSYTLIEAHSPGPRLEIFARRHREGWDRFGNEVESNVDLSPLGGLV
jgi:N6-adenosine-specific RNA methylase IME4